MEAACNIFYRIYGKGGRSGIIDNLLQRLDFHALSITLLATTPSYNAWDYDHLTEKWDTHRSWVLQTDQNESLAATIELSLASPTFRKLGPNAHDLLGVVAFFPQGVHEKNPDRFFPTIPDRKNIFDKFCVLSLTYRNNGIITMLAPIRDHLFPQDPESSLLLCATKDDYFTRLLGLLVLDTPRFAEAQWIMSEDVNVEHLLDIFASIDTGSDDVWKACYYFMNHLYWHKHHRAVLAQKIETLSDDRHAKPITLLHLSRLFNALDNRTEQKRLLIGAPGLERQRENGAGVVIALVELSDVNRMLNLHEEGISQAREASEVCARLGLPISQAHCLNLLAQSLLGDKQLDAAEAEVSRLFDLIPEKGHECLICQSHRLLGEIYRSKGEK